MGLPVVSPHTHWSFPPSVSRGIGRSGRFEKGITNPSTFWLYVVERAQSDDFRIHRIPNPPASANRSMFDDGWQCLAEEDEPESGQEVNP